MRAAGVRPCVQAPRQENQHVVYRFVAQLQAGLRLAQQNVRRHIGRFQPILALRRLLPAPRVREVADDQLELAVLFQRQADDGLRVQAVPIAQHRIIRRFFRQRHANQHQQRQQNACQPLHSFSLLPKYRMSRRQNVSFRGSSAVFHTFLTTMREPSICVTRIFVPFSMKSPSLTTFSRTPSNSPSPVGLSAVVAVPSRPRNTCMSSAER